MLGPVEAPLIAASKSVCWSSLVKYLVSSSWKWCSHVVLSPGQDVPDIWKYCSMKFELTIAKMSEMIYEDSSPLLTYNSRLRRTE
jgi:hypothetical protein